MSPIPQQYCNSNRMLKDNGTVVAIRGTVRRILHQDARYYSSRYLSLHNDNDNIVVATAGRSAPTCDGPPVATTHTRHSCLFRISAPGPRTCPSPRAPTTTRVLGGDGAYQTEESRSTGACLYPLTCCTHHACYKFFNRHALSMER